MKKMYSVIIVLIVLGISVLLMFCFKDIVKIKYLGELKIDPEQKHALEYARIEIREIQTNEIVKKEETNSPYIQRIISQEHKESIERIYNISFNFNANYEQGDVLVCYGSAIKRIVKGEEYPDELSNESFYADVTFEKEFDGNKMYFYIINRKDLIFNQ